MRLFKLAVVLGCWLTFGIFLTACDGPSTYVHRDRDPAKVDADAVGTGKNSPVSLVGEKFFRENRFSQYFYANSGGSYNQPPSRGDQVVENLETLEGLYKNPYKGQAISCAACHFVDQAKDIPNFGVRAYTDGSRRSRIPDRGDGQDRTVRNSPNMVAMALRDGMFLHNDGEFVRPEDLVRASPTWVFGLPTAPPTLWPARGPPASAHDDFQRLPDFDFT